MPHARLVGRRVLGHRPLNMERNDCALSLLSIKPTDRILEIGFDLGLASERRRHTKRRLSVMLGRDLFAHGRVGSLGDHQIAT